MNDIVVRAEGLGRIYGEGDTATHALNDATLELREGELVVLRGPSGSGKTTLLNLLGGLDTPSAGTVHIDGKDVTNASPADWVELRRTTIGYVFQAFALIPHLSAAENIELPLRLRRTLVAERSARVNELLELVELGGHANQRPSELSGGQQQRVGIARALANRPRLLIADEPTGQLDSLTAASMMSLIAELVHRHGVAALVSTHDPKMAAVADRVIDIHDGVIGTRPHGRHAA